MKAAIILPWRWKGDPNRLANFEHVLSYLHSLDLGTVVVADDGRDGDAPFNRSAAYNRGRAACPADVYVWHEADMLVPRAQLALGIKAAAERPGIVVPFSTYAYLSPETTERVRNGDTEDTAPEWVMPDGRSIGAVGITSEATMQAVGQWDEAFEGWGFDDNAMFHAFNIAAGPPRWVDGQARHLYHTPGWSPDLFPSPHAQQVAPAESAATQANRARYETGYLAAHAAEQIRALTLGA